MEKINLNERELHAFGSLCAKLGGIFGSDLNKILETRKGAVEVRRLVAFALGEKKFKEFLKKIGNNNEFFDLCFSDIYIPLIEAFLGK